MGLYPAGQVVEQTTAVNSLLFSICICAPAAPEVEPKLVLLLHLHFQSELLSDLIAAAVAVAQPQELAAVVAAGRTWPAHTTAWISYMSQMQSTAQQSTGA